jgi:hypothetical protein
MNIHPTSTVNGFCGGVEVVMDDGLKSTKRKRGG